MMKNNDPSDEQIKVQRYWLERAINLLSRREHSIVELEQKLCQRGCDSNLAKDIIEICLDKNYLNLERFAEVFSRNQASLGYGPRKVHYLLRQHQVTNDVIAVMMEEIDFDSAKSIALRKIGGKDPLKVRAALYRRGF